MNLLLADALVSLLASRIGGDLPSHAVVGIDGRVLLFAVLSTIAAGAAFAAVPAWQTARSDVNGTLKESARGTSGRHRVQRVLVVAEIGLALVLTASAGLMVRTMWHLWQIDPGFDPRGVLTFSLAGAPASDASPAALRESYAALEERLRHVPGAEHASVVFGSVPMNGDSEVPFWVEGEPHATEQSQLPWALFYIVSDDYRQAFGLHLVRGRFLTPQDTEKSPYVAVIDEELARTAFPSKDPIGARLHLAIIDADYQVVSIVKHVRHWGLDSDASARVRAQMYLPFRQLPDPVMPLAANSSNWIVRSPLAAGILEEQVQARRVRVQPEHDYVRGRADGGHHQRLAVAEATRAPAARLLRGARAGAGGDRHLRGDVATRAADDP